MTELASRISSTLLGWTVRGATLASAGSLERALRDMVSPLVYPFFMSEGYFTGEVLPRRLEEASATYRQMPAFGTDPAIPALVTEASMTGARIANLVPEDTSLLLAAHGSQVSPASRVATLELANVLRATTPFNIVVVGFIEEPPFLAGAARNLGPSICVPFFTLNAGHVMRDIPEAMATAGFEGPILPPIGTHFAVPRLIAAALERHVVKAAA